MMYDKKMIILSGENSVKGTAGIETNGKTITVDLNVFNLPNLNVGEYYFGLKKGFYSFTRALGGKGRISTRFSVPELEVEGVHVVVFNESDIPLAYGTLDKNRLWGGNMMDGLRRGVKNEENSKKGVETFAEKEIFSYSSRPKEIESYFNEIIPPANYADDQIAAVNYFEEEAVSKIQTVQDEPLSMPSELYRRYILRNKESASVAVQSLPKKENMETPIQIKENRAMPNQINENREMPFAKSSFFVSEPKIVEKRDMRKAALEGAKVMSLREIAASESTLKVPPVRTFSADRAAKSGKTSATFYQQIQHYIESLFNSGEKFSLLEKLIPSSRWVKVAVDEKRFYVVGLIGAPDYICYGVPGTYSQDAPKELEGYCSWTPSKETEPMGEGFYIMYQDAITGESL